MASLSNEGKNKWRIRFMDPAEKGKRRQLRFTATKKDAGTLFHVLERIIESRALGTAIQPQDAAWLATLPDRLYARIVRQGLVDARVVTEEQETPTVSLQSFLTEFVDSGVTLKGNKASEQTLRKWEGTKKLLLECFDGRRLIDSFGLADAKEFRKWMEQRKLTTTKRTPTGRMAENSIRQRIANCKTFFSHAVKEELVGDNPFRNQVSSLIKNDDGKQRIPEEVIDAVIEAAPDAQWRLLIALWRYAGLRKMEPLELTWNDVLWGEGKLRVRSPKTQHHRGKEMRYVPIRDVEKYLLEAAELAGDDERVISRYTRSMSNLHKPFEQIIEKAGFQPWPNLIKNLRLSCENDWLDRSEAPAHVIAAWIGHDIEVQNSHYAIVSDGHFEQFNSRKAASSKEGQKKPQTSPNLKGTGGKQGRKGGGVSLPKTQLRNKKAGSLNPARMLPQGLEP